MHDNQSTGRFNQPVNQHFKLTNNTDEGIWISNLGFIFLLWLKVTAMLKGEKNNLRRTFERQKMLFILGVVSNDME